MSYIKPRNVTTSWRNRSPLFKLRGSLTADIQLHHASLTVLLRRNELIEERTSKNKMLHSLIKENKSLSGSLKKVQKQSSKLTDKLDEAKAEIATLQGSVHSSYGSRHSSRGRHNEEGEAEITQVGL